MNSHVTTRVTAEGLRLIAGSRTTTTRPDPHEPVRRALRALRAHEERAAREARFAHLKRVYD
jgi:hypothetical protein